MALRFLLALLELSDRLTVYSQSGRRKEADPAECAPGDCGKMTIEEIRRLGRGICPCCDRGQRWLLMGFTGSGFPFTTASFSKQCWRKSAKLERAFSCSRLYL